MAIDFREMVRRKLGREKLSSYALAKRVRKDVKQRLVYDFMEGRAINMKALAAIMEACGFDMTSDASIIHVHDKNQTLEAQWKRWERQQPATAAPSP